MNVERLYGRIRAEAAEMQRFNAKRCGRPLGEVHFDEEFRLEVCFFGDALRKFPPADRKAWLQLVEEENDVLSGAYLQLAYQRRAYTRKKNGARRSVKRKSPEQSAARALRMWAIARVHASLELENLRPTIKMVSKRLAVDFPAIPAVELDTLRKDMRSLKVAYQSR